jgi:hypothetical protein
LDHPIFDHFIDTVAKANPAFSVAAEAFRDITKSKSGGDELIDQWYSAVSEPLVCIQDAETRVQKSQTTPVEIEKWAIDVMASTRAFYHSMYIIFSS